MNLTIDSLPDDEQEFATRFKAAPTREQVIFSEALNTIAACKRIFPVEHHDRLRPYTAEIEKAALAAKAGGPMQNFRDAMNRMVNRVSEAFMHARNHPNGWAHKKTASDELARWKGELSIFQWGAGAITQTLIAAPLSSLVESGITSIDFDAIDCKTGRITRSFMESCCFNPGGLPSAKRLQEARENAARPPAPIDQGRGIAPMVNGAFQLPVR